MDGDIHRFLPPDVAIRRERWAKLRIADVDAKTGKVQIKHGLLGGAKGGKGRTVYLGKAVRRALWLYLSSREDGEDPDAPLFVDKLNRPVNRDVLRQVVGALGEKAGVKNCHLRAHCGNRRCAAVLHCRSAAHKCHR